MNRKDRTQLTSLGLFVLIIYILSTASSGSSIPINTTTTFTTSTTTNPCPGCVQQGGGNPQPQVSTSTSSPSPPNSAQPMGYADFLYIGAPQGASTPQYANVIALKQQYPSVPIVAIINVGNGAGTSINSGLTSAISAMRAVGIVVIGYVYCWYNPPAFPSGGWRNLNGSDSLIGVNDQNRGLKQAIDAWAANYKIDGIFFDNSIPSEPPYPLTDSLGSPITIPSTSVYPGHTLLQYYQAASSYARSKGYTFLMSNVGRVFPEMVEVSDVLNIEDPLHGTLPTPAQIGSTNIAGTSEDFALDVYNQASVPTVAYLTSIQSSVSYVFINSACPGAINQCNPTFENGLLANLAQIDATSTTAPLSILPLLILASVVFIILKRK